MDMCGDKTVNKCLPCSVGNTEEQHFLLSPFTTSNTHGPSETLSLIFSLGTKLLFVYLHGLP